MRFERLSLKNFRNYPALDLPIPPGVVIFVGDNGQGKTNLIEAIYLLLCGQSFRPGQAEMFASHGQSAAFVNARLIRDGLSHDLQWQWREGRKSLEWNGKKAAGLQLAREFPLVLFSPESLASIKEGPEHRRQLVDDLLTTHSAQAVRLIQEFGKCLKTRNRVLKDFKNGETSEDTTKQLIESLDPTFFPLAAELTWLRLEALEALKTDLSRSVQFVLNAASAVEVEYLISQKSVIGWSRTALMDAMHQRSVELRAQELQSGVTLVGPHRHDIRFLFAGKDSRYFCSQGQQRALILSYKMAQIMYHYRAHNVYPFLLLDDVLSELDPDRRMSLVRFLKEIPSQIFLTTTDLSFSLDFGDRSLAVFRIEKGVIAGARDAESLRRHIDSGPGGP